MKNQFHTRNDFTQYFYIIPAHIALNILLPSQCVNVRKVAYINERDVISIQN